MLSATFLAPFLIPMFFFVITEKLFKTKPAESPASPGPACPIQREARPDETRHFPDRPGVLQDHAPQQRRADGCGHADYGCSLVPVYQRPDAPVAATYPTGDAYKSPVGAPASSTLPAADIGWRDFLADPRLQRLVQIALTTIGT